MCLSKLSSDMAQIRMYMDRLSLSEREAVHRQLLKADASDEKETNKENNINCSNWKEAFSSLSQL